MRGAMPPAWLLARTSTRPSQSRHAVEWIAGAGTGHMSDVSALPQCRRGLRCLDDQ
ncbi:hypothetical protein XFF6992_140138 [Xanthomonas citri pv. fuscans]|nr:hypothetical protein XFF6992_140138 [Xanthomonas citri pv. fuscans]SOO35958.1 hypothetical protein XFF6994_690003 [Xanthomonas citri pv. fuscans]